MLRYADRFNLYSPPELLQSIILTTNLPFKQWDTVFPNASYAVALIDRLTHHAEIVSIEGGSYRKRETERSQKSKR